MKFLFYTYKIRKNKQKKKGEIIYYSLGFFLLCVCRVIAIMTIFGNAEVDLLIFSYFFFFSLFFLLITRSLFRHCS